MNGWTIALASIGATYALWVFFLAVMHLQERRDAGTLGPVAYRLGVPILVVGYALDFIVNVGPCTLLFIEPPRETTVTARLKRHAPDNTWRGRVARWLARHLLDAFDPSGRHI